MWIPVVGFTDLSRLAASDSEKQKQYVKYKRYQYFIYLCADHSLWVMVVYYPGLPTRTEKNPLKTPDFSKKNPLKISA
jgi:hypothetical protein